MNNNVKQIAQKNPKWFWMWVIFVIFTIASLACWRFVNGDGKVILYVPAVIQDAGGNSVIINKPEMATRHHLAEMAKLLDQKGEHYEKRSDGIWIDSSLGNDRYRLAWFTKMAESRAIEQKDLVPYIPLVCLDSHDEVAFAEKPEMATDKHIAAMITILERYDCVFRVKDGKLWIERSLSNDRDLLWNYTNKAEDLINGRDIYKDH